MCNRIAKFKINPVNGKKSFVKRYLADEFGSVFTKSFNKMSAVIDASA